MVHGWRRHDLAGLSAAGWQVVLERDWDTSARDCLAHWAAHGLPLVVTRQAGAPDPSVPGDSLALGLPAPLRWGRRRIALQVRHRDVAGVQPFFPALQAVAELLAPVSAARCRQLHAGLAGHGLVAQVYGSHGWQWLTGLDYLHADSDLDLLVHVPDADGADAAAAMLAGSDIDHPRIDGELLLPDGSATAWREWHRWRRGDTDAILVKRRHGATLEHGDAWLRRRAMMDSPAHARH
ncbi:MAG: malonate decarboxylase holo-[acyl-carrier-protein] synthase [Burkholderiaceae bacterium]